MHVNPTVWGPSASTFDPARWLTPGGVPPPSELPHGWSGLVTFCDGPRNCIGRNLAYVEMKIILARLLWHFDLQSASDGSEEKDWLDQQV